MRYALYFLATGRPIVPIEKIIREVEKYPARHVVITGGEPLLAPELGELAAKLKAAGRHITIENRGDNLPGHAL